jgi:hypothetical protein
LDLERSKKQISALEGELKSRANNSEEIGMLRRLLENEKNNNGETIKSLKVSLDKKRLFFSKVNVLVDQSQAKIEALEKKIDDLDDQLAATKKKIKFELESNSMSGSRIDQLREIALMGLEDYNNLFQKNTEMKKYIRTFKSKFLASFDFDEKEKRLNDKIHCYYQVGTKISKKPSVANQQNSATILTGFTKIFTEGHFYVKFNSLNDILGTGPRTAKDMQEFFAVYSKKLDPGSTNPMDGSALLSKPFPKTPKISHDPTENLLFDKIPFEFSDLPLFNKLRIFKPTYYGLCKPEIGSVTDPGLETLIDQEFSLFQILQIVRAIFDCKFNEFQSSTDL